jgi:hypothetical protein
MSNSLAKKIAICTTTIFPIGTFLEEYCDNISSFGHLEKVHVYIAGDNKSPAGCKEAAEKISAKGLRTSFMSIQEQHDYLKRFADLIPIIPENSDNRRNVAYLRALEEGADIVISVDDDNFPLPGTDFAGEHMRIGRELTLPEAAGHEGWFNLCDLLEPRGGQAAKDANLYPRGFPYKYRCAETSMVSGASTGKIGINVGLWSRDPDTDAIGRLYARPHIEKADGREVLLGRGVRCPINTQNTALSREAMAAYYYVRMCESIKGMRLERFGDIFSGYFVQVCSDAVGDRIRIGTPVADHRRNSHNLLVDLYNELAGIMILEDMSSFLSSVTLPGDSYLSAYRALSKKLEAFAKEQEGFIWSSETKSYFAKICGYMRTWADVVDSLK